MKATDLEALTSLSRPTLDPHGSRLVVSAGHPSLTADANVAQLFSVPLDGSGPNGPGGQSQSFGQENKLGIADPHSGNPGTFCNPNRTPLPPQPNRTK